jgi:hypothetical protein
MRTARPLYQPRTKSIDQQKLELDRSKHVHQILQTHEARFGQILTWLFTSQGLLGAAYAYLKSQVAASQALNRIESFKAARGLLQAFPYFALIACGAILLALWSAAAANRQFRLQHASDPYLLTHQLAEAWPVATVVIAGLFTYGWLVVLPTLP